MNCSGLPLYHNHHQTHNQHSDCQCHTPSYCSTNYCWEVRVRCGLLPLCLTLWIIEWRDNNGTGAIHSQSQPLDCNCHIPGTPLFNVVHQACAVPCSLALNVTSSGFEEHSKALPEMCCKLNPHWQMFSVFSWTVVVTSTSLFCKSLNYNNNQVSFTVRDIHSQ